jgi:anti-sigma regulatory factor (Ser/Thr protein kinase)
VTSSEVARAANVTRQTAHYHLSRMTARGLLIHEGLRRASRYRLNAQRSHSYPMEGLTEDEVWGDERIALRQIDPLALEKPNVNQILNFAFTEMVNNAIDHSKGDFVTIRWILDSERIIFEVEDDGLGAFATLRDSRGLSSDFEAVGELSKGKQTTDPARHSGLGIFFTSRMVSRFVLSAGQLSWTVNNEIHDSALGWLDRPRRGTLVRCEIRRDTAMTPRQVYDERADPVSGRFNKTTIRVDLFREGDFVSRTEAKRIGTYLEGFEVIELDFSGVDGIGQAFADQLFRVWSSEHPTTRLVPVNANPAIAAMIGAVGR